ncbi:MAG: DUF4012 domain-containing protein [Candidatus Gracilibacteria bacterium]|nr:DUF4012 domain-containing protein [Candidatus Gracilibacteria bacterium]
MKIIDIRSDLDKTIEPFSDREKKVLYVDPIGTHTSLDLFENCLDDITLSNQQDISHAKKIPFSFKKQKVFDSLENKKPKTINLAQKIALSQKFSQLKSHGSYIVFGLKIKKLAFTYSNKLKFLLQRGYRKYIYTYYKYIFQKNDTQKTNNKTDQFTQLVIKKTHTMYGSDKQYYKNTKGRFKVHYINNNNKTHVEPLVGRNNHKNILLGIGKILLGLMFFSLFLKFSIEYNVNNGYKKLSEMKEGNIGFLELEKTIEESYLSFRMADFLFTPFGYIKNSNIQNGYHVIKGGKQISILGQEFFSLTSEIKQLVEKKGAENIYISEILSKNRKKSLRFEKILSQSLLHYDTVTELGDTNLQDTFDNVVIKLHNMLGYIRTINLNYDEFLNVIGHNEERKYLVVFQNNDEIRPMGGFMGSMGIVTLFKGKVVSVENSDVYAYEWEINKLYKQIDKEKIPAPKGLDKITGTWGLRDSNYEPETKKSAKDIKGFLDEIDIHIDGVVFINKSTIQKLIAVSGGVYFEAIDEVITDENFSRIISTLVEAKTFKQGSLGTPKQVLFDFADDFSAHINSSKNYVPYAKVLLNELLSRELIIYSFHTDENSLLWKLGMNGDIPFYKTLDFSYPVYTSIGGNKSDRYMKTEYIKTVEEISECHFQTDFSIIRKHTYTTEEENKVNILLDRFEVENKSHIRSIQGKADNRQYMRIYLPKNILVEEKEGLGIKYDKNYTILDFYMNTRLYETTRYDIHYELIKESCKGYSYKNYKQPGIPQYDIDFTFGNKKIQIQNLKKDFTILK